MSDYEIRTPTSHYFDLEQIRKDAPNSTEEYGEHKKEALLNPYRPSRFDFKKLKADLKSITNSNLEQLKHKNITVRSPTVVIVEGLYALYDEELLKLSSMKIFVDLDGDTRLGKWILNESGNVKAVFIAICNEYINYCRPEMETYINKTKDNADIILPRGNDPSSVKLIASGIYDKVSEEFIQHMRSNPGVITSPLPESFNSPTIASLIKLDAPPAFSLLDDSREQKFYDVN